MDCTWKPNWAETRQHFLDWWGHRGLVIGTSSTVFASRPHEPVPSPGPPPSIEASYTDYSWRARHNHYSLSCRSLCADILPIADTNMGPGSLACFIGSEPGFSPETVWFHPFIQDNKKPEELAPLQFDSQNRWWQLTEATLRECRALAGDRYLVGCPDLVENMDILAALRSPQQLLIDLVERPEWVKARIQEINQVWFEAYGRIYDLIKLPDGSSTFAAFALWGPGKTAKVQCDASAMFSSAMFERFVVPALAKQCAWLDHSMFHLDGHQCIRHLDALLAIEVLDAIEWTPDPQVPSGGSPEWYGMYRRILDAGKSVQAVDVHVAEVIPLLDAVGGKGMYLTVAFRDEAEAEALFQRIEAYR